jgi:hypothetical protein
MAKGKKAVQRAASPSMAGEDPERDDEQLENEAPPPKKRASAKKRKTTDDDDEAPQQATKPTKKPRGRKKAAEPPPEEEEEEEEQEEQEEDNEPAPDIDPEIVEQAFKQYRREHRRLPPPEELAEALECEVAVAQILIRKKKKAQDKLTNERKAKKVSGYNKMAVAAGYGDLKKPTLADAETHPLAFYSNAAARGFDSHRPLLSMSDMLRCAKYVPADPEYTSFEEEEFKMRCELLTTTLPADAARELLANADAVFKEVINRSVAVAMQRCGAAMVKPSHGIAVLKPIADNMLFSSINAPPGLIEHGKEVGALPADDHDARQKRDEKVAKANAVYHTNKLGEIAQAKIDAKAAREGAAAEAATRKAQRSGN